MATPGYSWSFWFFSGDLQVIGIESESVKCKEFITTFTIFLSLFNCSWKIKRKLSLKSAQGLEQSYFMCKHKAISSSFCFTRIVNTSQEEKLLALNFHSCMPQPPGHLRLESEEQLYFHRIGDSPLLKHMCLKLMVTVLGRRSSWTIQTLS